MINGKKEYRNVVDEIHKMWEQQQDVLMQNAELDGTIQ